MNYILASQSPRRREILQNLGVKFEVVVSNADENSRETDPCRLVEELSLAKGLAVKEKLLHEGHNLSDTVIIASDTVVVLDCQILGKPRNAAHAKEMLRALSGKSHKVISGVALLGCDRQGSAHEITEVVFDPLTDDMIDRYIATGEPFDKAGAYAIQGLAAPFISGICGDYLNVVGLPVHCLCGLFAQIFEKNFI